MNQINDKTKICFSKTLRFLRLQKKLSQESLAEKSGITRKQISRLECHRDTPSLETIRLLAKGLGITMQNLFSHFEKNFDESCESDSKLQVAELELSQKYHTRKKEK